MPNQYYNEFQPMSSQQRAAMAQTALINFFGNPATVSSILQMVQPQKSLNLVEHTNINDTDLIEQSQQLTDDVQVTIPDIQESMPLDSPISVENNNSHNNTYNNSQTIS